MSIDLRLKSVTKSLLIIWLFFLFGCNNNKISSELETLNARISNFSSTLENTRFRVYKTKNIHTALKLDTSTGEVDIIQLSLDDNEGLYSHSQKIIEHNATNIGRYELFSTPKMYQFILIDKKEGFTFRVQWGTNSKSNYRVKL